jgi:hypothetical protein
VLSFRPISALLYPHQGKGWLDPKWRSLVHVTCLHDTVKHFQFKESLISRRYFLSLSVLQKELILPYYLRILCRSLVIHSVKYIGSSGPYFAICAQHNVNVLHGKLESIIMSMFLQIDFYFSTV